MSVDPESLLNKKEYDKLELLFKSKLSTSTDINLFKTYIKYVKSQNKHAPLTTVYEFILKKIQHHWDVYPFIRDYIETLNNDITISEDEKIERTRNIYNNFFTTPMLNFNLLWKDYEQYETDLNRATARKLLEISLQTFQKTFRLYSLYNNLIKFSTKSVQDCITYREFYDVVEIEQRNVSQFEDDFLVERLDFIFRYFSERYDKEEIYFAWAEFLLKNSKKEEATGVIKNGMEKMENNFFLHCYYGTISEDERLTELMKKKLGEAMVISEQNDEVDLILINYLIHTYKNKGTEIFREVFRKHFNHEIGPHVFIFVAKTEYFTFQEKEVPFRIFTKALAKYPSNKNLQEEFIAFLLNSGDIVNARAFFTRCIKTASVCELMGRHEFLYGSNDKYREILQFEIEKDVRKKEYAVEYRKLENEYQKFKSHFEYFDISNEDIIFLEDFVKKLEKFEIMNLYCIRSDAIINLLKEIDI